jgi:serine/threonine-protein kinase PRP4
MLIRISPRHSRDPTPPVSTDILSQPPLLPPIPPMPTESQRQPEIDLDLPLSPLPVESTLAARRAKRLAIIAKHAGAGASPSSSSAVQPPQPISSISDPISQTHSVVDVINSDIDVAMNDPTSGSLFRLPALTTHCCI